MDRVRYFPLIRLQTHVPRFGREALGQVRALAALDFSAALHYLTSIMCNCSERKRK